MAQVSLRINGYAYILGCADGEEGHLLNLAADLDRRIEDIKVAAGPSGEARLLLMAALVVADELYELRRRAEADGTLPPPSEKPDPKAGKRLSRLSKRAEAIAAQVEMPPLESAPPEIPHPENIAAPPEEA